MAEICREWKPTPEELAAILDEMRPIVAEFARRDAARLAPARRELRRRSIYLHFQSGSRFSMNARRASWESSNPSSRAV